MTDRLGEVKDKLRTLTLNRDRPAAPSSIDNSLRSRTILGPVNHPDCTMKMYPTVSSLAGCALMILTAGGVAFGQYTPGRTLNSRAITTPANNGFGSSVALSPSYMAIGEPGNDDAGFSAGAVQIFGTTTGRFSRKIKGADTTALDAFGKAVAISGYYLLVGAPDHNASAGAAYVFDLRTGRQLRKLVPTDLAPGDQFGSAVSISGNLAVIGSANQNSGAGISSGAVYVFDVIKGIQLHKLIPSDSAASQIFGTSLSISGQTIAIGAPGNAGSRGAVYLFDAPSGSELRKIVPPSSVVGESVGRSVSINGGVVLAGAPEANGNRGAAYLLNATTGSELRRLTSPSAAAFEYFGLSVSLSGQLAAVGVPYGITNGEVLTFDVTDGALLTAPIPLSPSGSDQFGLAVAAGPGMILVGAPAHNTTAGAAVGEAYLYNTLHETTTPLQRIARKGTTAPGVGAAKFNALYPPAVSSSGGTGRVAFYATLTGTDAGRGTTATGIWADDTTGTNALMARPSQAIGAATLSSVKSPLFNDDKVVIFPGVLRGAGITSANDSALLVSTTLGGATELLREQSPLTGAAGVALSSWVQIVQDMSFNGSIAQMIRLKSNGTRVTSANDTGVFKIGATGTHLATSIEGSDAGLGSDIRDGQFNARVALANDSIIWSHSLVPGPTTPRGTLTSLNNQVVKWKLSDGAPAGVAARSGDAASAGVNYRTFLGETISYFEHEPTFRSTLIGATVTTANNEGIYRFALGQAVRKGDLVAPALLPGVKINRILKFWSLRYGQVVVLATLTGTGVSSATDQALILAHPAAGYTILMREGDPVDGTDGARVRSIQQVDVEPYGSHYTVIASLTGSSATNQGLFAGDLLVGGTLITPRLLCRADLRMRKGTSYRSGLLAPSPGTLRVASMSITTTTDVSGAGGKGLAQAIEDGGGVGLIINFSDRSREVRKGIP